MNEIDPMGKMQSAIAFFSSRESAASRYGSDVQPRASEPLTLQKQKESVDQAELQSSINDANARLAISGRELDLSFDSQSGVLTVRVVSKATGEVLLQVPAEKLAITRGALYSGLGLIIDRSP